MCVVYIALVVLYDIQRFLTTVEQFSFQQELEGVRSADGLWSARLHLLGFCLLARARTGLKNSGKDNRVGEAIRCFFRLKTHFIWCSLTITSSNYFLPSGSCSRRCLGLFLVLRFISIVKVLSWH